MSSLLPEKLLLLDRAAELRAAGTPWTAVATELKVADNELHTLRAANARAYDRLARQAEREFQRETVRATLTRLRELLKSTDEGVAMLAAGTVIRYELARMRNDLEAARDSFRKRQRQLLDEFTSPRKRPRDEFPPPPSGPVTAGKTGCDSGCDSPPARSEPPKTQRVAAGSMAVNSQRCDNAPSMSASTGTTPKPVPAPQAPPASLQPANPVAKQSQPPLIDATGRQGRHLAGTAQAHAVDQYALLGMAGNHQGGVPKIEGLMKSWLGQ